MKYNYTFYTDQLTENQRRFLKQRGCTVVSHQWMGGYTVKIENETAHAAWLLIGDDMRAVEVTEEYRVLKRPKGKVKLIGLSADSIVVDEVASEQLKNPLIHPKHIKE